MPGRPVGHQRVPATTAPGLGNAMLFKDQVLNAKTAQMLAGGHARLACANDERIDFCDVFGHFGILQHVFFGMLTL